MTPSLALRTGAILLLLLGVIRAAGGVMLAATGPDLVESTRIDETTGRLLGGGLVVVGLVAALASIGCMRRRAWGWGLGLVAIALFVADGLLNGTLLFGRPGDGGTMVNAAAAILILICLLRGKPALRERGASAAG